MKRRLSSFLLWLPLLLLAGCATTGRQRGLSADEEQQLLEYAVPPSAAGIVISQRPGNTVVRWREMTMPAEPVTIPLLASSSLHSHQPMVVARINSGAPTRLVLDTGSPVTLVDVTTALDNHLQVVEPDKLRTVFRGLGGEEQTYFGMMIQMTLGPELAFRNVLTAIRAEKYERRLGFLRVGTWSGNAIGMSTLANFAYITLDYPAQSATLSHREYFEEPEEAIARVPIKFENAQLRVSIKLGQQEVEALLDTGNDVELMVHSNLVQELGWQPLADRGTKSVFVGLGGAMTLRSFRVPEIQLGGVSFKKVNVVSGPKEFGVVLGSGFLSRYRATVDMRRKQLWLESSTAKK